MNQSKALRTVSETRHVNLARGLRRPRSWSALLFPACTLLMLLLLLVFPIAYNIVLSFQDWHLGSGRAATFTGFSNYVDLLFSNTRFHGAVLRTFVFTFLAVSLELILGVTMALIFNRQFAGRGLLRTLFLLPMVATPVAIALVWILILDPTIGLANYLLNSANLPRLLWIADPTLAFVSLVIVDAWQWTPFVMLITLAGLAALPHEPIEAAIIDGASYRQLLMYVILPLARPAIMVAVLFRSIDALKAFDTIYIITQGGPNLATETLNVYAYTEAFSNYRLGYAGAIVVAFFTIVLGVSLILIRLRRASAW